MSRLQLLILWVLAIAAGIVYFQRKNVPQSIDSQTNLEIGAKLIGGDTVEEIDGFKIEDGEDTVTLKKVEGEWSVVELDNFPANLSTVTRVFEALRDSKVAQGVPASQEYYDRFNLDPEAEDSDKQPERLTLISEDGDDTVLFLGKTRESTGGGGGNAGRFVRLSDDESGVYVVSESFGFPGAKPDNWIEKILTPLEEKAIKIEVSAPNDEAFNGWTVTRKTVLDDFEVAGLGETEETKTSETSLLKTAFNRASFSELVSKDDYEERADKKGIREVRATDSAGSTFLITITPEKKDEDEPAEQPDPSAPMPAINYLVSIEIVNGPTRPEPPAEDADVQEKAVFQERVANFADLAEAVGRMGRNYQGRYFLVNTASVDPFLKNRGELVQPKKKKKDPVSVATDPIEVPGTGNNPKRPVIGPGNPPPSIARPKDQADSKKRVEAVTPPIRIPPLEEKDKKEEKPETSDKAEAESAPVESDQPKKPAQPAKPEPAE